MKNVAIFRRSPDRVLVAVAIVLACFAAPTMTGAARCSAQQPFGDPAEDSAETAETIGEKASRSARSIGKFLLGKEADDLNRARTLYRSANDAFNAAAALPENQRSDAFYDAAKLFQKAGEAAEGKALEQDALFMRGESYFFADRLNQATEAYQLLQTNHPRNRHSDRATARLFAISRYWIDSAKVDDEKWFPINWTDSSRPRTDADGHAIRVLDQLRYDDPTGRLADDATMAAAAEFIRQKKYEDADEFLTDLRETFPDSDHLFLAHMLGIQCKLEIYRGPKYSGLILEEADEVIQQVRRKFPDKLKDEKYAEMLARSASTVTYLRADRYLTRADFREKRREFGAASFWYQKLLDEFSDTPQANKARERLAAIADFPAEPEQRLSWLLKVFPDSRAENSLEFETPASPDGGEVIRR